MTKLLCLQIDNLYNEAALKFVRLALACCHEKRKERPKMADTLAELNEIERMVAVADGREPEESVPASGESITRLRRYQGLSALLSLCLSAKSVKFAIARSGHERVKR